MHSHFVSLMLSSRHIMSEQEDQQVNRQEIAMTAQQSRFSSNAGFAMYKELVCGADASLLYFLKYEFFITLCSNISGLLGFGLRTLLYPSLFLRSGKRPAIGKGVLLRQPNRISVGSKILVDDYVALDVRDEESSITLGDKVSIGRQTTIAAKGGTVELEQGVNVGSYCRIATQSKVTIGESTLIGAYCYVGPGNHTRDEGSGNFIEGDMQIKGGVIIGKHCWLGARVTVLDGVTIGDGAIVGAHSVVKEDVPAGAVAVGIPAKVVSK